MPQKRNLKRYNKRLSLKFGIEEPVRTGYTEDISNDGLFVKTVNAYPPMTRLNIEITLPDKNIVKAEGVVMWLKKVPPSLVYMVKKSGMGIRITKITEGEELYRKLYGTEPL
ncbi:MAG: pilus assembly protein PilZ [Deltaproteobacteria bacterium GWC2_42_11]|nr:MAG: pilus assembly protein PilZ [Deltaproteobacteria bacterium GWC2_42_11]HBO84581.1 pilus assembly protein PilZ [Deltaproteobacteria bacterium]